MASIMSPYGTSSNAWIPTDNSLITATCALDSVNNGILSVAGVLYLCQMPLRGKSTLSKLTIIASVGSTGASSGSFLGVYSSTGALLAQTNDLGAIPGGTNTSYSLIQSAAVLPPFVWAGILVNYATTQPTFYVSDVSGFVGSVGITSASLFRYCQNGTGLSTLPANIVPANNTLGGSGPIAAWVGAS